MYEAINLVNVDGYEVLEGLYYHKEHFWVSVENGLARIGATDFGQKSLREVVFLELPFAGDQVSQDEPCGMIESIKAVVDIISPISGTVNETNEKLADNPGLVNEDPYGEGWLILISPSNLEDELNNLLNFEAALEWYKEVVKE